MSLSLATNVPTATFGIGGSPGESVFVKAGASTVEPLTEEDRNRHLRMNIDKGNQANGGGIEVRAGDELVPRERFRELERIQPESFSACTLRPSPERVVVVYNPLSARSRRSSDLAHELAHILLDHELSRLERLGDVTFFSCDAIQEEEAGWLSGCLLLPRALLLAEVRRGTSAKEIAKKCGISEQMAQYRLNVTGVLRQKRAIPKKSRNP